MSHCTLQQLPGDVVSLRIYTTGNADDVPTLLHLTCRADSRCALPTAYPSEAGVQVGIGSLEGKMISPSMPLLQLNLDALLENRSSHCSSQCTWRWKIVSISLEAIRVRWMIIMGFGICNGWQTIPALFRGMGMSVEAYRPSPKF